MLSLVSRFGAQRGDYSCSRMEWTSITCVKQRVRGGRIKRNMPWRKVAQTKLCTNSHIGCDISSDTLLLIHFTFIFNRCSVYHCHIVQMSPEGLVLIPSIPLQSLEGISNITNINSYCLLNTKTLFLEEPTVCIDNLSEKAVYCIARVAEGLLGQFFHAAMKTFVTEPS